MSISADEFRERAKHPDRLPEENSNPYRVLLFLMENSDRAFKQRKIADELNMPIGSVGPTLHRLHERGLVTHAEPYWKISDDDRLGAVAASRLGVSAVDPERYGDAPEMDEWLDDADVPSDR